LAIGEDLYDQNKQIFDTILYNTQKKNLNNLGQNQEIIKTVTEVFGSKPNNSNLAIFFRNEAIQALWSTSVWNQEFHQILKEADIATKMKLSNLFNKIAPPNFQIML